MAAVPDQHKGCASSSKTTAEEKVSPSSKEKERKRLSERARVDIGVAFKRWRELKAAQGMKSDAEVALSLLNVQQRSPSMSAPSVDSNKKMKFSQSEVQTMIEQEVQSAMKKNESKLQGFIETIQQLDRAVDYESSIQKLEARINTVNKRAEAALTSIKKEKSPRQSAANVVIISSDSEDETLSHDKKIMEHMDKNGELFQMMETTKKALQKMQAENKALKATIANLREKQLSFVLTPYGSSDCKDHVSVIKKESEDLEEKENNAEETKSERVKAGPPSPDKSSTTDKLSYPPLPATPFPSILSMEAATYNIPQKPEVRLALIRNPPSLSVLWNVSEIDPSAPPMESYSIYISVEKGKGSNLFPKWNTIGAVSASPLPMCVMINHYKRGHKVCVAVVGRDKFSRYGPYSEVVSATIPD